MKLKRGVRITGSCLFALIAPAKEPPNMIYILADDLGYGDLGCYGQEIIQTPHLDEMAAEGMRFTRHYAGSTVCGPYAGRLSAVQTGGRAAGIADSFASD